MSEKTPEHPQDSEPTGPDRAEDQRTGGSDAAAHPPAGAPAPAPHDQSPLATEAGQFRTAPLDLDVPFSTPTATDGHTRQYPHTRVYAQEQMPGSHPRPTAEHPQAEPPQAADQFPQPQLPTAEYPPTQVFGTPAQTHHLPTVAATDPSLGRHEAPVGQNGDHGRRAQPLPPRVAQPLPHQPRPAEPQAQHVPTGAPPAGAQSHRPGPHQPLSPQPHDPRQAARYPHHAQPLPGAQQAMQPQRPPRRRKPRTEPLTSVPVTGSMPLTRTDVTEIPADGPVEWPKRPVGIVGVANVILAAVMAVVWAWIPLGLLFTGIGGIFALGLGVLALVAWVLVQQVANVFERYRAELVYGDRIPVPSIPRSDRESGFARFLHNRWLLVSSGSFWRSTAHHYIKMLLGLVVVGGTFAGISASITAVFAAINPDGVSTFFLGGPTGGLGRIGLAIGALIVLASSLAILWFTPYLDRALDRSLLPPARTAALQAEVTELDRARMAGIDAASAERLRIERDLHDGAQPRLVALTMTLGLAKSKIDSDPERAKELISEAHAEAKGIVGELRQLARGIHPAVLTDRGLDAAVSALAGRSPIPVDVDVRLGGRIEREAEAVAYFVVAECLTNIAKHSGATAAKVLITPTESGVQIVVTDNGHGGARVDRSGRHTGIAGLVDRVEAARGTLNLTSPAGGPTTIVVEVPCAS
ncbi:MULTISPECIES: sensor histidine kinase [unclassified Brevibacterium]|uniref:sensor histidine kinase n=1 Tax=unclassified Brevibacterium TaxID=2614124 RepID=UPI0010F4809F|nr:MULTISPECIES: sensor histidine kinase [unclassified Brevibacterium]MCM1011197.1 histidine kinase [Brevibacterium sp. XM4083]